MQFGDYVKIEQARYGIPNEMFIHKVVGVLRSNSYVDVPVMCPQEKLHGNNCVPVVACVCCGVNERHIYHYRVEDVELCEPDSSPGFFVSS